MFAIIDVETTGGSPQKDKITDICILVHDGLSVVNRFSSLINPGRAIPPQITRLTGISNEMVADAPKFWEIGKQIIELTEGMIFVAHNVSFDYGFVHNEFKSFGYNYSREKLCTVRLSRKLIPGHPSYSLGNICSRLGIAIENRHRAEGDAVATAQLFDVILAKKNEHPSFRKQSITQLTSSRANEYSHWKKRKTPGA